MSLGLNLGLWGKGGRGGSPMPPDVPDIAWLPRSKTSPVVPGTTNDVNDLIKDLDPARYRDNPCLEFTGAETLSVPGLTGSDVVTLYDGSTATATPGTDEITFTAGLVYGIYINGVLTYLGCEHNGTSVWDVSGAGNHATLSTDTVRTTDDGAPAWLIALGHSPETLFDGDTDYLDVTEIKEFPRSNVTLEIEIRTTDTKGIMLNNSLFVYAGAFDTVDGDIDLGVGNPNYFVDGVLIAAPTRLKLYNAISDGVVHTLRIEGLELTPFDTFWMFRFSNELWCVEGEVKSIKWDWDSSGTWDNVIVPSLQDPTVMFDGITGAEFTNQGTGDLSQRYSPALVTPTKSILTLDGDTHITVDTPLIGTGDFIIETAIQPLEDNNDKIIFSQYAAGDVGRTILAQRTGGSVRLSIGGGNFVESSPGKLSYTEPVELRVEYTRADYRVKMYFDNELDVSGVIGTTASVLQVPSVIGYGASLPSSFHFEGGMCHIKVTNNGVVSGDYDFTTVIGKTDSTVADLSGNGNDGTIVPSVAGLSSVWGRRVPDPAGVVVDAAEYLLPQASPWHLNNPVNVVQHTDTAVLTHVGMLGYGSDGYAIPNVGVSDGHPKFQTADFGGGGDDVTIEHVGGVGGSWQVTSVSLTISESVVSDSEFPPLTIGAVTLVYFDNPWVTTDTYEFARLSIADYAAHPSGLGNWWIQWIKENYHCFPREGVLYRATYVWDVANYNKLNRWRTLFTDECGAGAYAPAMDEGGEWIRDVDDKLVLFPPS